MATTPRSAKSIFLEAVEKHQSDKWEAFLDGACGGDAEMRLRVEDLLNAHRESDSLLDQSEATVDFPRGEAEPGAMIGRYKLLQQIGEGGFGVVTARIIQKRLPFVGLVLLDGFQKDRLCALGRGGHGFAPIWLHLAMRIGDRCCLKSGKDFCVDRSFYSSRISDRSQARA